YENFQTTVQDGTQFITTNAGEAKSYGFEGQADVSVSSALDLFATYAYNHSRFENGVYDGNSFRLSPDHKASIGATWRLAAASGTVEIQPTYSWQSEVYFDDDNDIPALQTNNLVPDLVQDETQDSYGLMNLRVRYKPQSQNWALEAFGENILDEEFVKDAGNTGDALGMPTFIAGRPASYGLTVRMTLDRRSLLSLLGGGAALSGCATASPALYEGEVAFLHGVASGDPDQYSAVFWTRITPPQGSFGDIEATLEVASDQTFQTVIRRSTGRVARASRDFTVKHDLDGQGLEPGQTYFFRFIANGVISPTGQTRTLASGQTPDLSLAVVSCQLYPGGLFNTYDAIAKLERLDAVIHLGDYIYEYGAEPDAYGMTSGQALGRLPDPPHEIVSLQDYRRRHAQYKSDPDLQAAHARAAFICVWDDHEIANDAWLAGAENHQSETEGDYSARKANALKAYYEWMPIREAKPGRLDQAIQRSFHFGDLASLHMVETRLQARTRQLSYADMPKTSEGGPDVAAFDALRHDPSRELLGQAQRRWLKEALSASKALCRAWQILGNQVVMAKVKGPNVGQMVPPEQVAGLLQSLPEGVRAEVAASIDLFKLGVPFNLDSWDGYPAERERLYQDFAQAGVEPLVLAGDSHAFWVDELHDDKGVRRGVEFGTSAISSPSPGDAVGGLPLGLALMMANPEEVRFCDQTSKGYLLVALTPTTATVALKAVSTIQSKPYQVSDVKTFRVRLTPDGLGPLEEATPAA
ncbi:hypothetical protein LTR94_024772, partial [Friedmanniomyces endolithicus]